MSCCGNFSVPERLIPTQYVYRAAEAKKILSVTDLDSKQLAARIALAELGQIVFFAAQTVIFSLAYVGVISPVVAGIISFAILPIEAVFAYQTHVHFKPFSRCILTAATVITLATGALFAVLGIVADSAITISGGGMLLHCFRNLSEFLDAKNAQKDARYRNLVLNEHSPSSNHHTSSAE